jgi:DNA helicase HerA-like ATPase
VDQVAKPLSVFKSYLLIYPPISKKQERHALMEDFEKLGAFYLGRPFDLKKKSAKEGLLLYDSRDLVTHAVCLGMTGSGKTGLCIALLEEAAIDGVPSIVIDPKGDLSNLLLTFPDLKADDFAPWVNEEDAQK